jgi:hypothetical protein
VTLMIRVFSGDHVVTDCGERRCAIIMGVSSIMGDLPGVTVDFCS